MKKVFIIILLCITLASCSKTSRNVTDDSLRVELFDLKENYNDIIVQIDEQKKEIETLLEKNDALSNDIGRGKTSEDLEEVEVEQLVEDFHLLDSIPEYNIRLYGINPMGLILYISNSAYFINENYITPRMILPEINIADYDKDDFLEISLITHIGSGTGVSVDELFLIEVPQSNPEKEMFDLKDGLIESNKFELNDIKGILDKNIKTEIVEINNERCLEISSPNTKEVICLNELLSEEEIDGIISTFVIGDIVRFDNSEKIIRIDIGIALSTKDIAIPVYFGNISADLSYNNGIFNLEEITFYKE